MALSKLRLTILLAIGWVALYAALAPASQYLASLLGLSEGSGIGSALQFFLYEAPKVLLLTGVISVIGFIRTYFSAERTREALARRSRFTGNVLASLLGVVTPFCSCSAVPLFIGFVQAGIPLAVTFSFLIAAPMINEVALVLLLGMFGWKVALIYVATGLLIAVASGYVIGKLPVSPYVEEWVYTVQSRSPGPEATPSLDQRIEEAMRAVREVVGRVWLYILMGIGLGAAIHGYVPEDVLSGIMGKSAWWAVPLSVLIGVPLYSNAAGIIPIVSALLEKRVSLGTALAFMMSVIGLSLPETIILRKVLKPPLILLFIAVVALGIVTVGYLFNFII
jgi:hypothetical protein